MSNEKNFITIREMRIITSCCPKCWGKIREMHDAVLSALVRELIRNEIAFTTRHATPSERNILVNAKMLEQSRPVKNWPRYFLSGNFVVIGAVIRRGNLINSRWLKVINLPRNERFVRKTFKGDYGRSRELIILPVRPLFVVVTRPPKSFLAI